MPQGRRVGRERIPARPLAQSVLLAFFCGSDCDSYALIEEPLMWIAKGSFLGIWLFSFGTIAYLYLRIFRGLGSGGAVGVDLIAYFTTHNPFWWIALVLCFTFGLLITRSWSGKLALWIALMVTELFPVGLLTLFLVMVGRMKAMVGK
jgi:hypothetical protein